MQSGKTLTPFATDIVVIFKQVHRIAFAPKTAHSSKSSFVALHFSQFINKAIQVITAGDCSLLPTSEIDFVWFSTCRFRFNSVGGVVAQISRSLCAIRHFAVRICVRATVSHSSLACECFLFWIVIGVTHRLLQIKYRVCLLGGRANWLDVCKYYVILQLAVFCLVDLDCGVVSPACIF